MIRVSKVALLTAAMFSAAVFAQDEETDQSDVKNVSAAPVAVKNEKPSSAVSAPISVAPVAEKEKSGPKLRFSGDFYINPAWEFQNDWHNERVVQSGNHILTVKHEEKTKAFNVLYNWNTSLGVDFGDNFSVDFRLSNQSGYECDYLTFENGSAKELLPYLPNAYFTWRANDVFSLSGGLLEVTDNTVLNLTAGGETGSGLYSFYSNWATLYNNSQGGLKLGFDFSENFSLNLTAALVSETNKLSDYDIHNEFRFILDANIALGENVTLSPVVATRSFWKGGYYYSIKGDIEKYVDKTPILLTYGADLGFAFNDVFNLDLGFALGNIRWEKTRMKFKDGNEYYDDIIEFKNGDKLSYDKTDFGFLVKVAPTLTFGITEIGLGYSLGVINYNEKGKLTYGGKNASGKETSSTMFNDLWFSLLFRVNDYFALGPSASTIFETDKFNGKYKSEIQDLPADDNVKETRSGYKWSRFGIDFVVSF